MKSLSSQSEASRALALGRFHQLAAHIEEGRSLREVALQAGIAFRTAQRRVELYRRFGLTGLARKERNDQGSRRVISEHLVKAIEGLALERPPLPATAIHRQIKLIAAVIGEPEPSYRLVHRIASSLPQPLVTLAHEGTKSYSAAYDLIHRREASKQNAIWQADHCMLDIELLKENGSVARPWLTIVIDDYSRAIAGYYLGFDPPSSLRTSLALRQGIWRKGDPHWHICGIPEILYTDNGTDFKSKHLEQVAVDLKVQLVFSTPGKPQGRGRIERFFGTVNQMFLCDLDGYLRRARRKPTLTLDQLEQKFHTFLIEIYHRRPTSEGKLSPQERWEEGGFLPRMPDSLEQLDLLLMDEIRVRKVRPDGIHFHGLRYLSLTLAAYVSEEVTIRFDPRDMGEVRVFYKDQFLCRAISADLAGGIIPLRDILRARNRRRQELRTVLKDRQKMVDTLLEIKRGPALEEVHAPQLMRTEPTAPRLKRYFNE